MGTLRSESEVYVKKRPGVYFWASPLMIESHMAEDVTFWLAHNETAFGRQKWVD